MNHRSGTLILFVLVSLLLTSCRSYTRNLTRGHEVNPAFLSDVFEPGKSYKVTLRNREVFRIDVTAVSEDSVQGVFHFMAGDRIRKGESRALLDDIVEVKEKQFDAIKTALVIIVPIAVGSIIISNITFSGMTFW